MIVDLEMGDDGRGAAAEGVGGTSCTSSNSNSNNKKTLTTKTKTSTRMTTMMKDDESIRSNSNNSNSNNNLIARRRKVFTFLIVLVGVCGSAAFLTFGIVSQNREQNILFERRTNDITKSIEAAWAQYELFGLWVQESCFTPSELLLMQEEDDDDRRRNSATNNNLTIARKLRICSRKRFQMVVDYINSIGLKFQAAEIIVNVTDSDREELEMESKKFYKDSYGIAYNGLIGFTKNDETGQLDIRQQTKQPFYYPVQYALPIQGNEAALGLDLYSHPARRKAILRATNTFQPVITERIRLAQETDANAFSVLAFHPGVPLKFLADEKPTVLSAMVIRVPDLIEVAAQDASISISVSIFDCTDKDIGILPVFMGGGQIVVQQDGETIVVPEMKERNLTDIMTNSGSNKGTRSELRTLQIADREWAIAVTAHPGTFEPSLLFVILGSSMIAIASVILAFFFYTNMYRMIKIAKLKSEAEAEKSALILESAKRQALSERHLNEYMAHEVRNPLSSAIAALSFVSAATQKPTQTEESRKQLQDDVAIVDASLHFISDLLRNMLDMHRAVDKHLKITLAPTDIRRDVLEPVASILHLRGSKVEVSLDCPDNLIVETDRMRVKQIALNIVINSSKFVEQGFIRLRAEVVEGKTVRLYFEDSGPGIPHHKRSSLFAKYQESLDQLAQGTGLGLCLCKHLSVLLGGDIWLDETFESGVEGCGGTRFILDLGRAPMESSEHFAVVESNGNAKTESGVHNILAPKPDQLPKEVGPVGKRDIQEGEKDIQEGLPEVLRVLFVDDEHIIRKLFCRAVRRIAPKWIVEEASNGETALLMCQEKEWDIIFMDQYMASVVKQLLGTETVRALRAQGFQSKICGLSANNMEDGFLEAGANCFLLKPFPCEQNELRRELTRIWNSSDRPLVGATEMTDSSLPEVETEREHAMTV